MVSRVLSFLGRSVASVQARWLAVCTGVALVGGAAFSAVASATPTAAEEYAKEAAEKSTTEGTGGVKVFAVGIIGLIIFIVVVFFIWRLIRRVMH